MAKISTGDILSKDTLTEQDIKLICKRLNAGEKVDWENLPNFMTQASYELTEEQNAKGLAWLQKLWRTPRGIERKNNPFGYREQEVIANFSHFTLEQFYDAGNSQHSWFVPLYNCVGKQGGYFQYYVSGGVPVIIG
jgi:hypothetical protein